MNDKKATLLDEDPKVNAPEKPAAAAMGRLAVESKTESRPEQKFIQKTKFAFIHQDLKSALNVWEELSQQTPTLPADEKRLLEVKELLRKLQDKMAELGL
jgi:hypothetical protein